jgi:membrane-bound lytic murein transglycosylase A
MKSLAKVVVLAVALAGLGWRGAVVSQAQSGQIQPSQTQPEQPRNSASEHSSPINPPSNSNPPLQRVEWSLPQPDQPVAPQSQTLDLDSQLWSQPSRAALVRAIDYSLAYLNTPDAAAAYRNYPIAAFSREHVRHSLERFRQLLLRAPSAAALKTALQQEFDLYQSTGTDGKGTVHFTGYFEPVYQASRTPTAEFRYPLYRLPPDLAQWQPQPTRLELEGADGLQQAQRLRGLAIAWLRNRLDAYLVQVQGSARLQMSDGSILSIGYAGRTNYPYVSIGRELVEAGKIAQADLTLDAVKQYFQQHPDDLNVYLPRNKRFVFFQETGGAPAIGSLNVPVTPGRSIATDKTLMPPGALALIQTELPDAQGNIIPMRQFVLDQDTGGAIRGAGRVDLFMGTGEQAGKQAGLINHTGQLYYLLLKQRS